MDYSQKDCPDTRERGDAKIRTIYHQKLPVEGGAPPAVRRDKFTAGSTNCRTVEGMTTRDRTAGGSRGAIAFCGGSGLYYRDALGDKAMCWVVHGRC